MIAMGEVLQQWEIRSRAPDRRFRAAEATAHTPSPLRRPDGTRSCAGNLAILTESGCRHPLDHKTERQSMYSHPHHADPQYR